MSPFHRSGHNMDLRVCFSFSFVFFGLPGRQWQSRVAKAASCSDSSVWRIAWRSSDSSCFKSSSWQWGLTDWLVDGKGYWFAIALLTDSLSTVSGHSRYEPSNITLGNITFDLRCLVFVVQVAKEPEPAKSPISGVVAGEASPCGVFTCESCLCRIVKLFLWVLPNARLKAPFKLRFRRTTFLLKWFSFRFFSEPIVNCQDSDRKLANGKMQDNKFLHVFLTQDLLLFCCQKLYRCQDFGNLKSPAAKACEILVGLRRWMTLNPTVST